MSNLDIREPIVLFSECLQHFKIKILKKAITLDSGVKEYLKYVSVKNSLNTFARISRLTNVFILLKLSEMADGCLLEVKVSSLRKCNAFWTNLKYGPCIQKMIYSGLPKENLGPLSCTIIKSLNI